MCKDIFEPAEKCFLQQLEIETRREKNAIGEKRLRQTTGENEGADFILEVGSYIRFKRKLFEDYPGTAGTV